MGIVYRAHDEKLQRTVAIKVIGRETGITPVDRARIVEEARASSALSHPNICTVTKSARPVARPISPWSTSRAGRCQS